MGIVIEISSKKKYEPPSEGVHTAVLVDVIDLGRRHKIRLVWLLEELDSEGKPKRAFQTFTKTLHEKASLMKMLRQLGVHIPTSGSFTGDNLIARNAQLVIQHSESPQGKIYANVVAILKPAANTRKLDVPPDFVRESAQTNNNADNSNSAAAPKPGSNYLLPF
jgi:hypothetical protein